MGVYSKIVLAPTVFPETARHTFPASCSYPASRQSERAGIDIQSTRQQSSGSGSARVLQVFTLARYEMRVALRSSPKQCSCGARTDEWVRYVRAARCALGLQGAAGLPWTPLLACAEGSSSALPEGGGCERRKGQVNRRVCHAYCQRYSLHTALVQLAKHLAAACDFFDVSLWRL